jgi:hypothetical protein
MKPRNRAYYEFLAEGKLTRTLAGAAVAASSFFSPGTLSAKPEPKAIEQIQRQSILVVARTIWGEARGESVDGMRAVAAVIDARTANGKSHVAVCTQPKQFSYWNGRIGQLGLIPNRNEVRGLQDVKMWNHALIIAKELQDGRFVYPPKLSFKPKHYVTVALWNRAADELPGFVKIAKEDPTRKKVVIGRHVFF